MFRKIKKLLYFPVASYFRFFACLKLFFWKPTVVVITGSVGKTTLLHLISSQLQEKARYSYHANSAFGIPFDILGLKRKKLTIDEWFSLFIIAPFTLLKPSPKEKLYIVEADCDRPNEGKFLASLLKPKTTLLLNISKTHSMNFDYLVDKGKYKIVEEAIAFEFGYFLAYCSDLAIINGDSSLIQKQLSRTKVDIKKVFKRELQQYTVLRDSVIFTVENKKYAFPFLLPEDTFYALKMCIYLLDYLNIQLDPSFSHLYLPPGRNSLFHGIKDITIVDSSYNAQRTSIETMLSLFSCIPVKHKWVILGDILEHKKEEQSEHEALVPILMHLPVKRILLMGPRLSRYTYPIIKKQKTGVIIEQFETPKEVLVYILKNLKGKETLLFKGARFLEGVIEHLLANKEDIAKLCRREKVWEKRRKQWDL